MNKYWFIALVSFMGLVAIEVNENIWLIKEIKEINSKYANFMENNLNTSWNNTNFYNKYPYYLTEENYLCKKDYTISLNDLQETGKFSNAQQIHDDFANHSEKWRNLYLWTWWGIWAFQILMVLVTFLGLGGVCAFFKEENSKEQFSFIAALFIVYELASNWKLHLILLASFLQSAFIIFEFDDTNCITSPNPDEFAMVYTMKNWAIPMFGGGFLLALLYLSLLSLRAGLAESIINRRTSSNENLCFVISNIIVECIFFGDFLCRTIYFEKFYDNFPEKENELMDNLIKICLIYRVLFVWILIILGIVKQIMGDNFYNCNFNCNFNCKCNCYRRRREAAPRENIVMDPDLQPAPDLEGVEETQIQRPENGSMMFCTICMDMLVPGQDIIKIKQCKHIFHKQCLNEWGRKNKSCPMCRGNII